MLCLSIREPWASAIVDGVKTIEVRYWDWMPERVLQAAEAHALVAIHASRKVEDWAIEYFKKQGIPANINPDPGLGCVIGIAELARIRTYETQAEFDGDWVRHFNPGWIPPAGRTERARCFGICFQPNAIRLKKPIPILGQLGFFSADIENALEPDAVKNLNLHFPHHQRRGAEAIHAG